MTASVSLVVTVRNEAESVRDLVATVAGQTRPPDEVIVVDGGSTDGTVDRLRAAINGSGTWRVVQAPGTNISAGRNVGIDAAQGSIVAVTDAGTRLDPRWLERLVDPLDRDPDLAVSAGFFVPGGTSRLGRLLAPIITPHVSEIRPERFLPSSRSVAFRKSWWQRVGGYPEWLTHCEDLVFDMALKAAGARFAFARESLVTWNARSSLKGFYVQYFRYARGDGHALLWPKRHAVRYGSYLTGLALLGWARRRPAAGVLLGIGAGTYFSKLYVRLWRHLGREDPRRLVQAAALVPVVVVVGDVAKMVGYPVGRWQRRRRGLGAGPGR